MDKATVYLVGKTQREYAHLLIDQAPPDYVVTLKPPTRTDDQNKRLWAALQDVADQVVWHGAKLTREEWKDVCTAALKRLKVVPGLDGGFVVVGASTSRMSKTEFSDLLTLIYEFGDRHGVRWSEPAREPA